MRRRELIVGLGGLAVAWPLAARGQQTAMRVIGFIDLSSAEASANAVANFREGLNQAGFVEGRT